MIDIITLKSLFMAFSFIFAMYYSIVGLTNILHGSLKGALIAVFTEEPGTFYINIFPSFLAVIGWTVFAATKGLFTL